MIMEFDLRVVISAWLSEDLWHRGVVMINC